EERAALIVMLGRAVERDLTRADAEGVQQLRGRLVQRVAVGDDEAGIADPLLPAESENAQGEPLDDLDAQERFAAVPRDVQGTKPIEGFLEVGDERVLNVL